MKQRPPITTLFPYTTLFRSERPHGLEEFGAERLPRVRLREPVGAPGAVEVDPAAERVVPVVGARSEEHTSELQSHSDLVCRLLLEKKTTLKHLDYANIIQTH